MLVIWTALLTASKWVFLVIKLTFYASKLLDLFVFRFYIQLRFVPALGSYLHCSTHTAHTHNIPRGVPIFVGSASLPISLD